VRRAKLIWSKEALYDLEAIFDFIAEKSVQAAPRVVERIIAKATQLESFPESGPVEQSSKNRKMESRYLVEGHYKIIYDYSPIQRKVSVVTVFDTRYDPEKMRIG
jgi:toxin ParE1/3/4